jgi:hypothetical protein
MTICEFCIQRRQNGACGLGLSLPKQMRCHKFTPGIGQFCANPADFVNAAQIIQMANFFGIKGAEMKKVKRLVGETKGLSLSPQHR